MNTSLLRSRWAAIGAAIAVTLGAGGVGISQATTSTGERPIYVPLDAPCRLADNRPDGIGPDTSVIFDGWGIVGDCDLPDGTSGLALNITAVDATEQTNLRFYPADVPVPETANLNPSPGAPPIPNAVNVALSDTGQFSAYNRFGNVAVVIDVMGVYDDHTHDDRYRQIELDAQAAIGGGPDDVLIDGGTVVASLTIDTPTTGRVIVNADTVGWETTLDGLFARCSISQTESIDVGTQQGQPLPLGGREVFSMTRGFRIDRTALNEARQRTYYLVCSDNSIGTWEALNPHITAIFVPD